jgi:predicted permease
MAIGAGRLRIARQLLTECVLISLAGGSLGIVLSTLVLDTLSQRQFHPDLPLQFSLNADTRVFVFGFLVTLLTAALFGILPASRVWRSDPNQHLRGTGTLGPHRRLAGRDLILIAQVAMCCALVTASLVAMRGLVGVMRVRTGFRPEGVSVAGYDVGQAAYSEQQGRDFQRRALEAVLQLPGVQSAAYSDTVPLNTDQSATRVYAESTTDLRPKNGIPTQYYDVSPGYFATMGTTMLQGRDFTWMDAATSPSVAIVNETFARRVLGPGDWIGKRFRGLSRGDVEVVGVVEDGKYENLNEASRAALFVPISQDYSRNAMLLARSSRPGAEVAADMRRVLASIDATVPVYEVGSLSQLHRFVFLPISAATIALGTFGILAVLLAATGIYGVASYSVAQRTREIGIRVAIGAQRRSVVRLIFGRTAVLLGAGCAVGLLLSIMGAGVLSNVVLGTSVREPMVFVTSIAAMVLIAAASTFNPLRRALSVDPVQTLRQE